MYRVKQGESEFNVLIHLEQNNIAWMEDILRKLTKPGNLDADAYARILSVGKVCLLLLKQSRFIGRKTDSSCIAKAVR